MPLPSPLPVPPQLPAATNVATLARPLPLPIVPPAASVPIARNAAADAPKRQWVHLLPTGQLRGRDGRTWTLPPAKARQFVERSARANADRLVIDYEHQTDLAAENGGEAPAAGWIVELAVRPDGVWGLAEWTARAAAMIAGREYRFLSPTFLHTKAGEVLRLERAALTNNPNLILTALASRNAKAGATGRRTAPANRTTKALTKATTMKLPPELLEALDLPDDADLPTALDAIGALREANDMAANAAEPDPALYVPVAQVREMIATNSRPNVTDEQAKSAVDTAIERCALPPALREWGLSLCKANPDKFAEYCAVSPWTVLARPDPTIARNEAALNSRLGSDGRVFDRAGELVAQQLGLDPSALLD